MLKVEKENKNKNHETNWSLLHGFMGMDLA